MPVILQMKVVVDDNPDANSAQLKWIVIWDCCHLVFIWGFPRCFHLPTTDAS
jgi:hypothetical protein